MKKIIIASLLFLILFSISACDENTTESECVKQIILVWAELDEYYWNDQTGQEIETDNVYIDGVVIANPIPEFNYFKAAGIKFDDSFAFRNGPGYIDFDNTQPITSGYNPLTIEVNTSIGTVTGTVALPGSVNSVNLNVTDSLAIGQSLTVSWNNTGADFYEISAEFQYRDAEQNWHYIPLDTVTTSTSVTYPATIFTRDGEIEIWDIEAVNGPFPSAGMEGNMTGEGSGFFYLVNDLDDFDIEITVGNGLYGLEKSPVSDINKNESINKTRQLLQQILNP